MKAAGLAMKSTYLKLLSNEKKERFDQNVLQAAAQAAQSSYLQGLPVGYPNFGATYPQGYIGYTSLIHPDDRYHNTCFSAW